MKLTVPEPRNFNQCQICGREDTDICSFSMWEWVEGPEGRLPFLIACKGKAGKRGACERAICADEDLFKRVIWSRGGSGAFMLLCGDCPSREGFRCTHPHLKDNGGDGLLVNMQPLFGAGARICFTDGHSLTGADLCPVVACEGHPTRLPTVNDRVESPEKP